MNDAPTGLTIDQLHSVCVRQGALAHALALTTGSWSRDVVTSQVAGAPRLLAAHSAELAWHATLWHERVPTIEEAGGIETDNLVDSFVAVLNAPTEPTARLAQLYRIALPSVVHAHTVVAEAVDPRTDGPTHRVLTLVINDLRGAVANGAALLDSSSDAGQATHLDAGTGTGTDSGTVADERVRAALAPLIEVDAAE